MSVGSARTGSSRSRGSITAAGSLRNSSDRSRGLREVKPGKGDHPLRATPGPHSVRTTGASMSGSTSSPLSVRRHHWIVRLTHWATLIVLAGMIASGLQIYEAYARVGNRGGPYFVSPFDGAHVPHWSRLGGWLAGALHWHFALAWPRVAFGLLYLGYLARSGARRRLLIRPRDVPEIGRASCRERV